MSILNKIKNIFKDKQSIKKLSSINNTDVDNNENRDMSVLIEEYLNKINSTGIDSYKNNDCKNDYYYNYGVRSIDINLGNNISHTTNESKEIDDDEDIFVGNNKDLSYNSIENLYLKDSFEYKRDNKNNSKDDFQNRGINYVDLLNINTFRLYEDLYFHLESIFSLYNLSNRWYNSVKNRVLSNTTMYNVSILTERTSKLNNILEQIYMEELSNFSVYDERIRKYKELKNCIRLEGNILYGIMVYDEYDELTYDNKVCEIVKLMNELTLYKYDFKMWNKGKDDFNDSDGIYNLDDRYIYYCDRKITIKV